MSSLVLSSMGLKDHVGLSPYLHAEKKNDEEEIMWKRNDLICLGDQEDDKEKEEEEEDSSESSSIGAESASEEEKEGGGEGDDEEEVESRKGEGDHFGSLNSLEESLPIKRGLSNFFSGKSKSFASLSEAGNANAINDLAKRENPFNKRRRILLAYKAKRASYNSLTSTTYLPSLLSPDHAIDEGEEEEKEDYLVSYLPPLPSHSNNNNNNNTDHKKKMMIKNAFRSPRSFSLSDLQHA